MNFSVQLFGLVVILMSMSVFIEAQDKKGGRDIIILGGGGHKGDSGHKQHHQWYPYYVPVPVPVEKHVPVYVPVEKHVPVYVEKHEP